MMEDYEFDVETVEIAEGRALYLYTFPAGEENAGPKGRAADNTEGRGAGDDAPA